jgi:hypothetical protein
MAIDQDTHVPCSADRIAELPKDGVTFLIGEPFAIRLQNASRDFPS